MLADLIRFPSRKPLPSWGGPGPALGLGWTALAKMPCRCRSVRRRRRILSHPSHLREEAGLGVFIPSAWSHDNRGFAVNADFSGAGDLQIFLTFVMVVVFVDK